MKECKFNDWEFKTFFKLVTLTDKKYSLNRKADILIKKYKATSLFSAAAYTIQNIIWSSKRERELRFFL